MNNEIQRMLQDVASDSVYADGIARWMRSRTNSMLEYGLFLENVLNEAENPLAGTTITDVNSVMQISNTDAIKLSEFIDAYKTDRDVVTLAGKSYSVDEVLRIYNENLSNFDILASCLETVSCADSQVDYGISQLQSKVAALTNSYGDKADMLSSVFRVVADKNIGTRDKIGGIMTLFGASEIADDSSAEAISTQLNSESAQAFGGLNPLYAAGVQVWKTATNVLTWQDVLMAVYSPVMIAINGIKLAWNWAKNNPDKIINVGRKVAEFTSIQNTEFKRSDAPMNECENTIDNCLMIFTDTFMNCVDRIWYSSFEENVHYLDRRTIMDFFGKIPPYATEKYEFPGFIVYVRNDKYAESRTDRVYSFGIKFKPIPLNSDSTRIVNLVAGQTWSDYYTALDSLGDSCLTDSIPLEYWAADEYFKNCLLFGKAVAYSFAHRYITDKLVSNFDSNSLFLELTLLCATGQGLNPALSEHTVVSGNQTYADPTNQDFMKIATYVYGQPSDVAYYADADWSKLIGVFMGACVKTYIYAKDGDFVPYTTVGQVTRGRYHINTDQDNVSRVFMRTGFVIGTAAVVGLSIAGLKLRTSLRQSAIKANIAASIAQDNMKKAIMAGEKITPEMDAEVYKLTKKAVRLNKLTGGFASVTTGLSTWQEGNLGGTGIDRSIQELKIVITG